MDSVANRREVYGDLHGVLIAMCVILSSIALSLEGNEVAVGTTNPFAREK